MSLDEVIGANGIAVKWVAYPLSNCDPTVTHEFMILV